MGPLIGLHPAMARSWVMAGCPRLVGWRPRSFTWLAGRGRWAYGLMVMVSVALTMLSCESCSCMGKLKVPA